MKVRRTSSRSTRCAFLPLAALLLVAACSSGGSSGAGAPSESRDEIVSPLVGEPIAGLTEDAVGKALTAAEDALGYDFANDRLVSLPFAPSQLLIRPGAQIVPESIFPGWCTAAFVFDDRSRIATAGHCTQAGDAVLALAAPTTIFALGFTSTSTGPDSEIGDDWALIDILPQWRAFTDPAVALAGGPCGRGNPSSALVVKYVGHGAVIGTGGTLRFGLAAGEENGALLALGPSYMGDSGAPILDAVQAPTGSTLCTGGAALGILTHGEVLDFGGPLQVPTGFFFGTPIERIGNSMDDGALLP